MTKEDFIKHKMRILVGDENYSKSQAFAIANSMYHQKNKAQQGTQANSAYLPPRPQSLEDSMGAYEVLRASIKPSFNVDSEYMPDLRTPEQKQEDYLIYRASIKPGFNPNSTYKADTRHPEQAGMDYKALRARENPIMQNGAPIANNYQQGGEKLYAQTGVNFKPMQLPQDIGYNFNTQSTTPYTYQNQYNQENYQLPTTNVNNNGFQYNPFAVDSGVPSGILKKEELLSPTTAQNPQQNQTQYNDITRYNIPNLYGGVDLESSLAYAGQGFGEGNYGQAALGTGLAALKGARNFMTGFASGKESDRVKKEMYNDLYNPKINYAYAQQGGKAELTNSEFLTGQYVTDEGRGNYNVEGGEYLQRAKTGQVQEVVGDKHIKNGKEAEGVNVQLENGDKVLSDYTKIPAKNVKELKERYDLSLRKNATFADAQKAFDKKLGIQKETDSLAGLIEKFGKNSTTEDATTRRLNDLVLSKKIEVGKKKLDLLGDPQAMMFDDLFNIQESIPKRGKPGELLDKSGKPIEETKAPVAQQGIRFTKPPLEDYSNEELPASNVQDEYSNMDVVTEYNAPDEMSEEAAKTLLESYYKDEKAFDSNSARDTWVHKTGLPWSEAKRLGYTDGSAKDNIKLLSELNDDRFRKENLRKEPLKSVTTSRTPIQHTSAAKKEGTSAQTYTEAMKGKPSYVRNQGEIRSPEDSYLINRVGERLANPIQTFGNLAKYGEFPADGFSKNSKNEYDRALGAINPVYWANALGNASDYANEGEYKKAVVEALDALPAASRLKYVKYLPFNKGLPPASVRRAGYIGDGVKQIGEGSTKYLPKFQQGGEIETLANRYGITVERAHELLTMQLGGEANEQTQEPIQQETSQEQPTQEQVMQFIAQSLQQGATPEQILQQLVENGIPSEVAQQLVGTVAQQMQGEQEQASQQEMPPEGQQMTQEGTEKQYAQEGFSFATKYSPTLAGYAVTSNPILNQDILSGVESTQHYSPEKGYGEKMTDVEKTISLHDWYFNTPEKKETFRAASKKKGEQPEIKAFQQAYNVELLKRANDAGVPKEEVNKIISEVGFTGENARQEDGLFGAFTSTRPLYSFTKQDGEVKATVTPVEATPVSTTEQRNITKQALPWLPENLRLAPSALNPLSKEQITLPRAQAVKLTPEPQLAEAERLRQSDVARVQASGLSPAQQESLLSQGLASSQMAANTAIGQTEQANQASQQQTNQFNLNQAAKEQITNSQYNQVFQNQVLGGLNNYEDSWRNYFREGDVQNASNFRTTDDINMFNATQDQFNYVPGVGAIALNNKPTNLALGHLTDEQRALLTPEEEEAYKKAKAAENRISGLKKYKTSVQTA
jgi:hypothetical protein